MAPTPASQANAAPILRNPTRRRTGFEAGAAGERFSDSRSSVWHQQNRDFRAWPAQSRRLERFVELETKESWAFGITRPSQRRDRCGLRGKLENAFVSTLIPQRASTSHRVGARPGHPISGHLGTKTTPITYANSE